MRRRDFLDTIATPLLAGLGSPGPRWLFRTFPGRIGSADPLRQWWLRFCPDAHMWLGAVAAETMPQTAVLAWFPSLKASRSASPRAAELFEATPGGWGAFSILEFRESPDSTPGAQGGVLKNPHGVLIGFKDMTERWRIPDRAMGRIALFRAEPGSVLVLPTRW